MPSLRKRVSTYLRQLSFHNEPREKKNNINENAFVTKYLQGLITLRDGPIIVHGKNPTDLPNYEVQSYEIGHDSIVGCYSGPHGGLTTVKRIEKHLSVLDDDIDFIDNHEEEEEKLPSPLPALKKSPIRVAGQPIDNSTMVIKVAGNEYCVTNKPKRHSKSHSLGSISDFKFTVEVEKTKIDKEFYNCDITENQKQSTTDNNNIKTKDIHQEKTSVVDVDNNDKLKQSRNVSTVQTESSHHQKVTDKSYSLSKCRSEGNPFHHKKRGKIIQVQRQHSHRGDESNQSDLKENDLDLPEEWKRKTDKCFGISDSLYDRNLITKHKNGDPIADCFGIIARGDSAILAVADGVNWGEKASIAAKSAIHAALHYLNKTIFNDTRPFEKLTNQSEETSSTDAPRNAISLISNTREVFVCLLRAFNCAHDLILENQGMLTTLTVAVVLPLKSRISQSSYVCCVCNVGDTLAYVYSQRYGMRELTKGSHDVTSNRDMRDALGALGPVDGINPELSNLTLSITTLNQGDIVLVASDGLTDNFDPNVCKFTVNSRTVDASKNKPKKTSIPQQQLHISKLPHQEPLPVPKDKPPVKPPRRSKNRGSSVSSSSERSSSSAEKECLKQSSSNEPSKKLVPVVETKTSNLRKQATLQHTNRLNSEGYKFLKSKTALDLRSNSTNHQKVQILRNEDGIPFVTPIQRYELQLLLMEDILKNGISGRDRPTTTAKRLCENLISFTMSITAAKRRTLEDLDMYFDSRNGLLVEVSGQEKKIRRKRGLEKVQTLPGKLDHVTVVAYNVGNVAF